LAVRAHIRHQYTDYEKAVDASFEEAINEDDSGYYDDARYSEIRSEAENKVSEFLENHRR
jgi:hypothetical protein